MSCHLIKTSTLLKLPTKAVMLLAGTPIREYTNDLCEGFFCSRVFFSVFDFCGIVIRGFTDISYKMTSFLFVYP
jgi:hypothetical protein